MPNLLLGLMYIEISDVRPKLDWNFDEIDHGPGMSAQLVIWSKMAVNLIVGIRCSTDVKFIRKMIFVNVCGLSFTFSFFPLHWVPTHRLTFPFQASVRCFS